MKGNFSVPQSDLFIRREEKIDSGESLTVISDRISGFEIITTGGFAVAKGNLCEFGDSFFDFTGSWRK